MGGNLLYLTGMVDKRTLEKYERDAVTGDTTALLGAATQTVHWAAAVTPPAAGATALPAGSGAGLTEGLPPRTLFLPWGERRLGQLNVQHRGTEQGMVVGDQQGGVGHGASLPCGSYPHPLSAQTPNKNAPQPAAEGHLSLHLSGSRSGCRQGRITGWRFPGGQRGLLGSTRSRC